MSSQRRAHADAPADGGIALAPGAFLLGTPKAATTWLAAQLSRHPGIQFSYPKEPNALGLHRGSIATRFDKAAEPPDYTSHFKPGDGLRIDGSIHYFSDPVAPRVIQRHFPSARFIVCLREPIARSHSHWQMVSRLGDLPKFGLTADTFEEAMRLPHFHRDSLYGTLARHWLTLFPREQFLFITDFELKQDLDGVARALETHLGLAPASLLLDRDEKVNPPLRDRWWFAGLRRMSQLLGKRRYERMRAWYQAKVPTKWEQRMKRPLQTERPGKRDYARFAPFFRDEIRYLEEVAGIDCGPWLAQYDDMGV